MVVVLGFVHERFGRGVGHAPRRSRLDGLHRRALNALDLRQQIFELGVGLAVDRHPTEVADIAVIVAAGVEREHVALAPFLLRRCAVEARARRDQTIVEGKAAIGLLPPQRFGQLPLGRAGAVIGNDRQHRFDHALGGDAQLPQLLGTLHRAQPLEHEQRVHNFAVEEGVA